MLPLGCLCQMAGVNPEEDVEAFEACVRNRDLSLNLAKC